VSQGGEIPRVTRQGPLAIPEEVGRPLPQRRPLGPATAAATPASADTEFLRLVDHRLDSEDPTGLVVPLEPVLFHSMLDPPPGESSIEGGVDLVGEHLAFERAVELPTEAAQDGLGRNVEGTVVQQPGQELPQGWRLLNTRSVAYSDWVVTQSCGIGASTPGSHDPPRVAVQAGHPPQAREAIREGLRAPEILEPQKRVVRLGVPHAVSRELPRQSLLPVHVDRQRERNPRLPPRGEEAEIAIPEGGVQDEALPPSGRDEGGALPPPERKRPLASSGAERYPRSPRREIAWRMGVERP
jgi:hypothetical protein